MAFKVGDNVVSVGNLCKGEKGIVTDVNGTCCFVHFYNGKYFWVDEENLISPRSFKLIPGKHIVRTRHGNIYLLVEGTDMKLTGIGIKHKGYVAFDLDNDLKDIVSHTFDIMEVFEFDVDCWENITNNLKSVWKREEAKEMTVAEIEKLLGHKVKIIKEGK